MGQILRNWRIASALAFAVVLIGGSFMLARGVLGPSAAEASAESALLQAIATRDSDSDGLRDWEEALYGTSPNTTDTNQLGMTDGEAVSRGLIVPKAIADITLSTSAPSSGSAVDYAEHGLKEPSEHTLTDALAKNFFTLYVTAKQANGGADLSVADTNALVNRVLDSLASSVITAPDFKSASDLAVSSPGTDALIAFAINAEAVLHKNTSSAQMSEILYLQQAVEDENADALAHLASIAKAYRESAAGLSVLAVPPELAAADTALVNALMRVSEIISDFARVNTDPLTTMLALNHYMPAAQALGKAFADIASIYGASGIMLSPGTPGAAFVNVMAEVTARQQAALKTP